MSDKSGKVSHASFLPPGFVTELQTQAREYAALEQVKSRREWAFGESVNCMWERLAPEIKAEISKDMFYVECSHHINASVEFPIVSASGETLRRWCEVAAAYRDMPGVELIRESLSFDHFRRARALANKGKVSVPAYALAVAVTHKYTAEEMSHHFDPPQAPNEYERVTGWLDGLQATRFSWLPKEKRERLASLLQEIRKILE